MYALWGSFLTRHPEMLETAHATIDIHWDRRPVTETIGSAGLAVQSMAQRHGVLHPDDFSPPWYEAPWFQPQADVADYVQRLYDKIRCFAHSDVRAIVSINPVTHDSATVYPARRSGSIMAASTSFDIARLRRARVAVSLGFLVFGTELGLWFAHIPEVAKRLSLEPARLGLGILSVGVIGLVMQPVTGLAIARFGSRRTTMVLLPAFVAAETLLINAPSQRAFFMFSALVGLVGIPSNVGNNTMAAELERLYGRPVMSSFHGFFSVGGLVGSLLGGALIAAGEGDGRGAISPAQGDCSAVISASDSARL